MAYERVFRLHRVLLLRELPDVATLLSSTELKPCFTDYEKGEILAPLVPSDRAAKLLDCMETKSYHIYEKFVIAVRPFKPNLARKLENAEKEIRDSSPASSSGSSPSCKCCSVLCIPY